MTPPKNDNSGAIDEQTLKSGSVPQPADLRAALQYFRYPGTTHGIRLADEHVEHILSLCEAAALAALPEKPSNKLIEMSLQNGKPQQAASYNGYSAAIATAHDNIRKVFGTEGL